MAVSVSNGSSRSLTIWIEPWCDELRLPSRATALFEPSDESAGGAGSIEIEAIGDRLVVWPCVPGTITVSIGGELQATGSRTIPITSNMLELPVKSFVSLAFADVPSARAAGAPLPVGRSGISRL